MDDLLRQLQAKGMRYAVVPATRARDLESEITARRSAELDAAFARERLDILRFELPRDIEARSLIVVALPRPPYEATFTWQGRTRSTCLPPIYVDYEKTTARIVALLGDLLSTEGYHVAGTSLPLKLLAARSGLGRYGRNNICYVEGMGSFHQLVAVYSDMPCDGDSWGEPQMLARCQDCRACAHRCPTAAIPADRFLLHAERCLSYHNEKPAGVSFPAWIEPGWHNTLIGCMRCQEDCPENRDCRAALGGREAFTDEETALLLAGALEEQLPAETRGKLERLDILDMLGTLPRNLGALLPAQG